MGRGLTLLEDDIEDDVEVEVEAVWGSLFMVKLPLPWESEGALNFTYRPFANHLVLFEGYF